jgi:hypothetical protein
MGKQPQQPELRRSGKGAAVQDSAKAKANSDNRDVDRDGRPTPPGNQPGWMQPQEQPAVTDDEA